MKMLKMEINVEKTKQNKKQSNLHFKPQVKISENNSDSWSSYQQDIQLTQSSEKNYVSEAKQKSEWQI